MNGMLIKEFLQLKRTSHVNTISFILVSLVLISILGIRTNMLRWVLIYTFNSGTAGSILRYDVPTFWNRWCVTAPIPRKDIVISKHVMSAIYEVIAFITVAIGIWIFINFNKVNPIYEIHYTISSLSILILFDTVTLTCIFWRGGFHGGRISYFINTFLMLIYAWIPVSKTSNISWLILLVSLIIRIASVPLSVWLYNRRSL